MKKLLENNCKNIWTSVEVYGYYVESGGIVFSSFGSKTGKRVGRRFTDSVIARVSQHIDIPQTSC